MVSASVRVFFFQAEDGIRDYKVTGVQTCALPISMKTSPTTRRRGTSPQFAVHEFPCADILALLLYGFVEERVPGWYGSECGELAGSERRSQEESAEPRNSVRAASSSGTWTRRSRHR